jgi:peptide/nickel transport system permease protein
MLVVYWTDLLVYALLLGVAWVSWRARQRQDIRRAWAYVLQSRVAMAAAVVLSAYLLIAVLDSIHYRLDAGAGARVVSVFDTLVQTLREQQEKTYSAPFATHLYTKENIDLPDGSETRGYPRLRHGGGHLQDPATQRGRDVLQRCVWALLGALAGVAVLLSSFVLWRARRSGQPAYDVLTRLSDRKSPVPWPIIFIMLGLVLLGVFICAGLATHYHVLGTDKVGQDVLYQALKSIRTGVLIGTLTTLVTLPLAILLGVTAGYFGGWVDDAVQYVYTTLNSIPGVLLIAATVLMLQVYMTANTEHYASLEARSDLRLLWLCIILGMTNWTGLCRLLRGEALKLREAEFVLAAQVMGLSNWRILWRHLIPNVMHLVLIAVVLDFSGLVLAEAVLSYVNIGVDPTMNSWGNMINAARLELAREPVVWWPLLTAFGFMSVLVLAANLFADVVREGFDPRLRDTIGSEQ